jgi:hypothetical protein
MRKRPSPWNLPERKARKWICWKFAGAQGQYRAQFQRISKRLHSPRLSSEQRNSNLSQKNNASTNLNAFVQGFNERHNRSDDHHSSYSNHVHNFNIHQYSLNARQHFRHERRHQPNITQYFLIDDQGFSKTHHYFQMNTFRKTFPGSKTKMVPTNQPANTGCNRKSRSGR